MPALPYSPSLTGQLAQAAPVQPIQRRLAQLLQRRAQAQHAAPRRAAAAAAAVLLHQGRQHIGQLQHALQLRQPASREGGVAAHSVRPAQAKQGRGPDM